jgi:hypothetical protein
MDTVVFLNPITKRMAAMPTEMIAAYVPFASDLHLEEAAKVAAIRDDEAAANLLLSIVGVQHPEVLGEFESITDGTFFDRSAVEPPSLR